MTYIVKHRYRSYPKSWSPWQLDYRVKRFPRAKRQNLIKQLLSIHDRALTFIFKLYYIFNPTKATGLKPNEQHAAECGRAVGGVPGQRPRDVARLHVHLVAVRADRQHERRGLVATREVCRVRLHLFLENTAIARDYSGSIRTDSSNGQTTQTPGRDS